MAQIPPNYFPQNQEPQSVPSLKKVLEETDLIGIKKQDCVPATNGKCYLKAEDLQNIICTGFLVGSKLVRKITGIDKKIAVPRCKYIPDAGEGKKMLRFTFTDESDPLNKKNIYENSIEVEHQVIKEGDKDMIPFDVKAKIISAGFDQVRPILKILRFDETQFAFQTEIKEIETGSGKYALLMGVKREVEE